MQPKNKLIIYWIILLIILLAGAFTIDNFDSSVLPLEEKLMTDQELKEKIGQMLLIGFRATEVSENSGIVKTIQDLNIGGVVLFDYDVPSKSFPRNITSPEQTKKLIADLQKFSETPLLVAVDAEGGLINRLKAKYGFIGVPSHQELGEKDNPEETKKIAEQLAKQLTDLGFNINLAPVIDVNINPENPIIGGLERSFSDDPQKVAKQALAFIQGHKKYNILTTLKHFPGHGSSFSDSHKGLVDVTNTYQEKELIPYQEIIKKNMADAIMTAHIINRNIDPEYPATLSPLFIEKILRQELNFQGVVISDDMQMGAITENYGFEEAVIKAVNAGCDIIAISNNGQNYDESIAYQARDIIFKAVKENKIPIKRIIESSDRIRKLKNAL